MCSGSKAGSNLRRIDFVYHSTLGLRVIKREDAAVIRGLVHHLHIKAAGFRVRKRGVKPDFSCASEGSVHHLHSKVANFRVLGQDWFHRIVPRADCTRTENTRNRT